MTEPETGTTVIVGAGHAGGRAAEALRAAAPDRRIVLVGRETHPPYERPALSKDLLLGTQEAAATYLFPVDWYAEAGIDLRLGTDVVALDRGASDVVLRDGTRIRYDTLLLTTGARPRRLPPPLDHDGIHSLRSIDDADRLARVIAPGRRIVIVGAGFIGLEVASSARRRGAEVHVVERAAYPLARVADPMVGRVVADHHRAHGVTLHCDTTVTALDPVGTGYRVRLGTGDVLEADTVVVGIGAVPNTDLAEAAGLTVDDGIVTDWEGRTSDPAIRAAGDCTRHFNPLYGRHLRLEAWQNAQDEAIAVARAMAGLAPARSPVPWFWSDQFDLNIQCAGLPETGDRQVIRRGTGKDAFMIFSLAGDRLVGATAINHPRDMRTVRRLMERSVPVDPGALADPAVRLAGLA